MTHGSFHWSIRLREEHCSVHWDLLSPRWGLILKRRVTELQTYHLYATPAHPCGGNTLPGSHSQGLNRDIHDLCMLFANTVRWDENHCQSYLYGAALQKHIGGFSVLIKHNNINMIFASSQRLSSEHSQVELRKFLWFQLNTNAVNFMVTIWPVSFLPSSHLHLSLLLCPSRENSFPGFTVGLTCLLGSPLTQWLMVRSAASLDLVNIRNYSQISVISDRLWAEKWDSLPDTKASGLG